MPSPLRCRRCRIYSLLCLLVLAVLFYGQGYPAYRAARFRHAWETGDIETLNAMTGAEVFFFKKNGRCAFRCEYGHSIWPPEDRKLAGNFYFDRKLLRRSNISQILTGSAEFLFFCESTSPPHSEYIIIGGSIEVSRDQIEMAFIWIRD